MTRDTGETERRVIMATDVPFWRGSTGAEQRMLALSRFLSRDPFRLTVFFLGRVGPQDQIAMERSGLDVVFFESERPPEPFLKRIQWYVEATRHQLENWIRGFRQKDDHAAPQPLTLEDYRWPWAIEQFRRLVHRLKPSVVICQYVTMAYLLDALAPADRRQTLCVLDTHDILHERGRQFSTAGFLHWLEIDEREEIDVWNRFDVVIAIQEQEKHWIEMLTSRPAVIVAGHALDHLPTVSGPHELQQTLVLGYIGSDNYSNWHAINRFLIEVWPDISQEMEPRVELKIAGKICEWFQMTREETPDQNTHRLMDRVELMGHLADLGEFYKVVDLVVNPVQFGTGLKIKNVEALAFGKPLVTTTSGAVGMPRESLAGARVVENMDEMRTALLELCRQRSRLEQLQLAAKTLGKSIFSAEFVFSELRDTLVSLAPSAKF